MSTRVIAALVVAAFLSSAVAAQPMRGGALPGPLPLSPPDNWWNADISRAPVGTNSSRLIDFIGRSRTLHPDLGGDTGDMAPNQLIYGIPYGAGFLKP